MILRRLILSAGLVLVGVLMGWVAHNANQEAVEPTVVVAVDYRADRWTPASSSSQTMGAPASTSPTVVSASSPLSAPPPGLSTTAPESSSPSSGAEPVHSGSFTRDSASAPAGRAESVITPAPAADCATTRRSYPFFGLASPQITQQIRQLTAQDDFNTVTQLERIHCVPHATWIASGYTPRTVRVIEEVLTEAHRHDQIPLFVMYNNPVYERAGWHTGTTPEAYQAWVQAVADAISSTSAWVILEPDALATANRYAEAEQAKRITELATAVNTLTQNSAARVYIDVGHSHWLSLADAETLLRAVNVEKAAGFSLNVSNFQSTTDQLAYGNALAERFAEASFVIDTARNGNGAPADNEWCNPRGRALGRAPELTPGATYLDAFLWVKPPGESDGYCNGGPRAGTFWLDYALELVENADR